MSSPHLLRRSLSYFRSDAPSVALSLILIALGKAAELLQVYPFAILADQTFGNLPAGDRITRAMLALSPSSKVGQIIALASFVLILRLIQETLGLAITFLNVRIGYGGLLRIRSELFKHLQRLGMDFHRRTPQGETLYRLAYDTAGVQAVLNAVVQGVVVSSITLVIMLVILLNKNIPLTLLSLAVAPPLFVATRVYGRVLANRSTTAKQHEADLTASMQQSLATVSLTQAFGRERDEFDRFSTIAHQSVRSFFRLHIHEMLLWLWIGVIFGLGGSAVFGVGGYLVYRDQFVRHLGEAGMTLGKLWIFIAYLSMLYSPLKNLSGSGAALAGGLSSAKRVFELLDEPPSVRDAPDAQPLPRMLRMLAFNDVSFAYEPGRPVLEHLSLTIGPGEAVAIVGPSGVGKSTLLSLVNRVHDPTTGAITLDGVDLRTVKLGDVRAQVAVVQQDTILLPGSVRENIAYGRPDASDADIRNAAQLADIEFDAVLAEGGANLSGGQRQRIGIARAILSQAPILILDEPTSALDVESESKLVDVLRTLRGRRTILLVSHRASTTAACDRVINLSAPFSGGPAGAFDSVSLEPFAPPSRVNARLSS